MAHSFNRTEMLPPLPPPVTERGAIKWLRENLFSGPVEMIGILPVDPSGNR